MTRPRWWMAPLLALVLMTPAWADERPNVVLIVADDLGWSDLGCYGSKFHRTPNLDALAAGGRRFSRAYAAAPVCSPTRAALLTGQYPARLHLTDWLPGRPDRPDQKLLRPEIRQELPAEARTLAEALKAAGYATAHIGKWHLGGPGAEPTARGFESNIGGDAAGTPLSYFAPFSRQGRAMPGLAAAPEGESLTDRLTTEAEQFIARHKDRPFFLYLPHFAVHIPLVAKPDLVAHYPAWDGTYHGRQENPIYAAMLENLDEGVGRVIKALDQAGVGDRTLVLFTSDNGGLATREGPNTPATSNSPLREGKGYLYEGGLRVPLIASWPSKIAAGLDDTPVWSGDIVPTVESLCGIPGPSKADGLSLAGRLLKDEPLPARSLYWHYPHYSNQGGRPGGAILDGPWKLVEFYDNGRRELFDVAKDPVESTNKAEAEPAKVEELAAKLAAWRQAVGAQSMRPNPEYVPNPQAKDGTVHLPGRTAEVHGTMLRFEPLPHKDTLGYWVRVEDWASWELQVTTPGTFEVTAFVGCATGSGGSDVEFRLGDQILRLTVPVTGGFQKFEPQKLGRFAIDRPGFHTLEVRPVRKPGLAVMDLREIRFEPVRP